MNKNCKKPKYLVNYEKDFFLNKIIKSFKFFIKIYSIIG